MTGIGAIYARPTYTIEHTETRETESRYNTSAKRMRVVHQLHHVVRSAEVVCFRHVELDGTMCKRMDDAQLAETVD